MSIQSIQDDVIIVGGGLAGLSAASYLAREGLKVTLYEKASRVGGRAITRDVDGYLFNRGGHALYVGGAATSVLQELEIPYGGQSPNANFMLNGDTIHLLPSSLRTLVKGRFLSITEQMEFARLLVSFSGIKPDSLARVSVWEWLGRVVRHERVRQVLAALAHTFTYSAALDQVSAEVFIVQAKLALKKPVLYIEGGWQSLVDGLSHAAESAGARIVSGARIDAILYQNGCIDGVRLHSGEIRSARSVIVAAGPRDASALIDDGSHPYLSSLAKSIVPVEVACLDVALRHLPPEPHYRAVFDLDQPRLLAFQSLTARYAPPEGGLIHTLKYLDPSCPTDALEDERELERLLDVVQPGWRAEEIRRFSLPRLAAMNMLVTANSGGLSGRPGPQVKGISGLYLAGDWVGSEGYLIDASLASARQASRLLLSQSNLPTLSGKFALSGVS